MAAASRPRLLFFGSPGFAVPSLSALCERPDLCEVVAVVTQPDKPAGRGQKLTACAVKVAAQARGLPVVSPSKMKAPETREQLAELRADLAVVAAYGRILPPALLAVPRLGCVNVHASLLPRHRGASPIAAAILAGDAQTGVTIMQMDEGLDTGPLYGARALPIAADATTGSLTVELAALGARLLVELLPEILAGSLRPVPQGAVGVTHTGLLDKQDGALDFSRPAAELERRIRAMTPWPGAFAQLRGERLLILRATVQPADRGLPGEVVRADAGGVVVRCGEGGLALIEVKPAARKQMSAAAWLAGRGVSLGERLETPPSV